jgi:hypothetical protein
MPRTAVTRAVETLMRRGWAGAVLLLHCALALAATTPGESLYRQGVLSSGAMLTGARGEALKVEGADAACVNCHRRSGLGMKEGPTSIPPISGMYLFHPRATTIDDLDLPYVETVRPDRDPYSDATLARAIRAGIGADGKELSYLMPRYTIGDADMAALIAYLKGMTQLPVPGVTDSVLHFATIVTPDADPLKRQGVLDVLQQYFRDKSDATRAESPRLRSSRRMMFKANRRWQLHVWNLTGPANTWEKQLQQYLLGEPVFAVISGVGGKNWAPIHHFCEQASLPCLFPNIEVPVVAEHDFYPLYFSKGVLLEAQLMAHELAAADMPRGRIVQIYRTDDVGAAAATELKAALSHTSREVLDRPLNGSGAAGLARAVKDVGSGDTVILWLRPTDLVSLPPTPGSAAAVMLSGLMGDLAKAPLPAGWRRLARMAYPMDLPARRVVRVDYALGWFNLRHIPVVSEQAQADTYLACGLVSETLNHMADSFIRDYLIERIEETLEHRVLTGYYPRLSLAAGQRFASKGGYLVRFTEDSGVRIAAASDWIVP